ncbi:MAG: YitT family protein [Ruminococcaceae bacterium]|nr:YitT family protein [Oscillospiraceae bacterium]
MKEKFARLKATNIIMLTIAGIINAIGVVCFLTPVHLYDSGISGTSVLLSQVTPAWATLSVFLLILNIPLFLYGLRRQGKLFTLYSIYAVVIYSVAAWLITDVLPIDVDFASPLAGTDLLLCALFGGLISGIGSGLVIRNGGAIDGVEVMAVIFAKRIGISVGTFVMMFNILLYVAAGVVLKDWILPLYSIIAYAAALKTVDFIVEGVDRAKCAMIITSEPDKICAELMETFETGATKIDVIGGYSNSPKTMVYFIVNRFQVIKLKEIVHSIDKSAYITISEVADIFSSNQKK